MLPCSGHGYCEDCWKQYIALAVEEGKGCLELCCPAPKCGERVRASLVHRLCKPTIVDRYERFWLDTFVEDSKDRKWCPGAGCGRACARSGSGSSAVTCGCGVEWCFECSNDQHQPVSCNVVKRWNEKTPSAWILANTKACPKCSKPIEKNGGCMHMTCRKPGGCGHEFCWICMQDHTKAPKCNPFAKAEAANVKEARPEIQRYLHYWERFNAHEQAQQFAFKDLEARMAAVVAYYDADGGFESNDVEFLVDAARQIGKCHRFLKWTYAFGYFLKTSPDATKLFEFHQAQLEGTLERLSDLIENTRWDEFIDADPFYDKRTQTTSLVSVVRQFFDSLCLWMEETFPDEVD